jgi:tRNA A37 threonylcarbamoyltransferase TsaD
MHRLCVTKVLPLVKAALEEAKLQPSDLDAIAYTKGTPLVSPCTTQRNLHNHIPSHG